LLAFKDIQQQLLDHVRNERAEQAVRAEIDSLADAAEIKVLIPLGRSDEQKTN